MTAFSSRRFNQDVSAAKRATKDGPVFITDRGKPAHVLISIEEYRRLAGGANKPTIADMLAMPEGTDFDFDFDSVRSRELARGFDFDAD